MLLKSLELSIFCSICILRSIFHTRKPLERAISCIFHTIQWIRGLCPGPSDGDPESLNLSLNSEKRTPNSEKNPVMNQAEKHQYGDARNRPAHETIRDGLGFGDHLGLAHLLLGHAEQCQQLPVAFAEIAHCSLPSSCGRTNPEREVSPSSRPAWIPSRYGKSPLV